MNAPEQLPPPEPPAPPSDPPSTPQSNDPASPPSSSDPPPTPPADPAPTPDPVPPDQGSGEATPGPSDNGAGNGAGNSAGNGTGADHRQPVRDEFTTATAGSGNSATAPPSDAARSETEFGSGGPGDDTWLGQDTFVLSEAAVDDRAAPPTISRRFGGLLLVGATISAKRIEAKARQSHQTAQVSALGSGPPGPGNPLPGNNPFFNLLSGPGGIAASLMLASMLAVLGAAFLLPRDRLRAFRTPTVTWRPLAYVPPIELPG